MYKDLKKLSGYKIIARDGEIGDMKDFYFDEQLWVIRYLIVNTGNWLIKKLVLVSPICIDEIDDEKKEIKINQTKEQVENSPDVDAAKPVSRQKEIELSTYYRTGLYWDGYNTWGMVSIPIGLRDFADPYPNDKDFSKNAHLRSVEEVCGYHVQTKTGELGHIKDMTINEKNWQIDFFVLNTKNILPGKDIEFSIRWVKDISWETQKVYVKLAKEDII